MKLVSRWRYQLYRLLTISARLYRSLDIPNTLYCHPVLIVSVNILVFELANLIKQDTEFVGDIRNILVTCLAPDG